MTPSPLILAVLASVPALAQEDPATDTGIEIASEQPAPPSESQGAEVQPPVLVDSESPLHPLGSAGDPTDVQVVVHIDAQGRVVSVEFPDEVPELFQEPTRRAIERSTFRPATKNGIPVPFTARLQVHFEPTAPEALHDHDLDASSEEVVVYGAHRHGPERAAGDIHLDLDDVQAVPTPRAADALELAPSVFITYAGSSSKPLQLFMRGFDARHGQDVQFMVDGMPLNQVGNPHGHGLVDINWVIPETLRGMRVLEGPYDPSQGDFAVAGSVQMELGLPEPGMMVKVQGGSFRTARGVVGWRHPRNRGTFVAAEGFSTAGYGENRRALRGSAIARVAFEGAADAFLLANVYGADYRHAGLVKLEDVEAGRLDLYGTQDPNQGGSHMQAALAFGADGGDGGWLWQTHGSLALRSMDLKNDFTGFLHDERREGEVLHPQRGDMLQQTTDALTVSASANVRREYADGGLLRGAVQAGLYGRFDDVDGLSQRLRDADQAPYRTDADYTLRQANVAPFVDGELQVADWFTARAGLRLESFFYDLTDHCATRDFWSALEGGRWEDNCPSASRLGFREPNSRRNAAGMAPAPRASVGFQVAPGHSIRAAYGRGLRSLEARAVSQGEAAPFGTLDSVELGWVWRHNSDRWRGTHRVVGYMTHVGRDYVFDEEEGTNLVAGDSNRWGFTAESEVHVGGFTERTTVAGTYAVFGDKDPPNYGYGRNDRQAGMLIPYVPPWMVRTDLSYGYSLGEEWTLRHGVSFRLITPRPLPQSERSDWVYVTDLNTTARWRNVQLGLTFTNLFNTRYNLAEYNYASWFPDDSGSAFPTRVATRQVSPGAPFSVLADVTVWFHDL